MTFTYKFGKKPARSGAVKLRFADFADKAELRKAKAADTLHAPADFGHERLIAQKDWGMLGNDTYGCCLWSGAGHEERLWAYEGQAPISITTGSTLTNYAECTGFDITKTDAQGNNPTDNGTDMQEGAEYRRTKGLIDAHGNRLKIEAYLALKAGDLEELALATWLFSATGVGIEVPSCFMDQFDAGKPWDISTAPGAMKTEGGHYIPSVARRGSDFYIVTYAKCWPITERALLQTNDESIAYLTKRNLYNGKSPEGFDYAGLQSKLAALTA